MLGFLSTLFSFDFFPALFDLLFVQARRFQRRVEIASREHVRVAANQFAGDAINHTVEFETPFFPGQLAVIHHLKQQIAQLALQMIKVTALDGISYFIGFFKGMRDDTGVSLFDIPRTAKLRIAQPGHEVEQVLEVMHGVPFGHSGKLQASKRQVKAAFA